ncbi:hypothetical protein LTR28_000612 [Elasticomyces elasticus]|nr:hypothetical protein LTR28_000612 [Elasticomyces elasticus]
MVSGALAPCDAQLLRLLNQLEGRASRPAKWAKALTLTPVKRLKRNLLRRAYMKFDATANGISLNWAGRVRMPDPPPTTELTYPMPCRCFPSSDDSLPSLRSYMNNESCQQHPPSTSIRYRASETADPTTCISPQSRLARYRLASAKPRNTLGPSLAISFPSTLYPVSVVGKRETHELGVAAAAAAAAVGCVLVIFAGGRGKCREDN